MSEQNRVVRGGEAVAWDHSPTCWALVVTQSCNSRVGVCLFLGSPLLIVICKACITPSVVPNRNYLLASVCGAAMSQTVFMLRFCSAAQTEVIVSAEKIHVLCTYNSFFLVVW